MAEIIKNTEQNPETDTTETKDETADKKETDTESAANTDDTDKEKDNTDEKKEPEADATTEKKESEAADTAPTKDADSVEDDAIDDDDYFDQTTTDTSKKDHPFRDFFSNFRSKRKLELNRDELILSRISDDDLMEYLRLEQKRLELLQQAKDVREKRIWIAFQVAIAFLSVVLIVYFLKDSPVILVTIMYTIGILAALRIWKRSESSDKNHSKDSTDPFSKL